jgi:predicted nuclease of predicted toxin-antitoxin system
MGVSRHVASWLRGQGHDVVHLREQGLQRLPDLEIYEKAVREGRIVLTFDLEFGRLATTANVVASVILFRLNVGSTGRVRSGLLEVLSTAAERLESGSVVVVEDYRIRVKRLSTFE